MTELANRDRNIPGYCTCRYNNGGAILSHDYRCPVDEHAAQGFPPDDPTDPADIAYLKAQQSPEWDRRHGGGL